MLFKVTRPLSGKDTSSVPVRLVPFEFLTPTYSTRERLLLVSGKERASDGYVIIGLLGNARWRKPSRKIVKACSAEIWSLAGIRRADEFVT